MGGLHLQTRRISVITVQIPVELKTQHIYQLNAGDYLLLCLIPLAVDHRIHHKYPKMLSIPILITAYDAVHITRTTMIGILHPIEIEDIEVSDILSTKSENQTPQIVKLNSLLCHLNQVSIQNKLI